MAVLYVTAVETHTLEYEINQFFQNQNFQKIVLSVNERGVSFLWKNSVYLLSVQTNDYNKFT